MPFKNLEHEGNENFNEFSIRQDVKREKKEKVNQRKLTKYERLEEQQKEWLSPENPFIWDGDVDWD